MSSLDTVIQDLVIANRILAKEDVVDAYGHVSVRHPDDLSHFLIARSLATEGELADGARMLRESNGTAFVVLRVKPTDPPAFRRNMDPSACRYRFRTALLRRS